MSSNLIIKKNISVVLKFKSFIIRSYADLAYNTKTNEKTNVTNDNNQTYESVITSVKPGINSTTQWTKHHPIPDPKFEVVSPGTLGALLLVKIPPRSEIFAFPGAAISVSSKIHVERTTEGNILIALGRKFAGGSLIYHKFSTGPDPGDVILSPKNLSDIAKIEMDGDSEYYVRKNAFLARGPRVSINIGHIRGMGALNAFAYRVTGRGTLVISNYGTIHKLVLNPDDDYLVNAKYLVAWNSKTYPIVSNSLIKSSSIQRNKLVNRISQKISETSSSFLDSIKSSPTIRPMLNRICKFSVATRKWAFGGPEFLKLTGPGDFYLSSRIEPVLGASPSIEEIVAADPMNSHNKKPSSSLSSPPYLPSMSYAIVSNDGGISFVKSPSSSKIENASTLANKSYGIKRWVLGKIGLNKNIKRE
ncbi:20099_t:CDS:2 [Entrophospora sp. SA101]|nr:20099_t:CDS:2 [Entrophospora sp. SA101]CAJ0917131.1 8222_t:CDS:2 [Entrophospora sp. SA101]CAJ0917150.1 8229_t:CDS:2 [Entrophospora sp. SA101]